MTDAAYDRNSYVSIPSFGNVAVKSQAAPQRVPQHTGTPNVRVMRTTPAQRRAQAKKVGLYNRVNVARIVGTALVVVFLFGAILASRAQLTSLERTATEIEESIAEVNSEYTRLCMLRNASLSRENIEAYAVNVLGMQKLERCQIRYFESLDSDEVVLCAGAVPKEAVEQSDTVQLD